MTPFQGVTAELLKEIISIFYAPLAQVYKAANIGGSISDLQTFITDLIRVVEATEESESPSYLFSTKSNRNGGISERSGSSGYRANFH